MTKRADIAESRWMGWACMYARDAQGSIEERAEYGMDRTAAESEHGGTGIGRATYRRARKNWKAWTAQVADRLRKTEASSGQ